MHQIHVSVDSEERYVDFSDSVTPLKLAQKTNKQNRFLFTTSSAVSVNGNEKLLQWRTRKLTSISKSACSFQIPSD